MSKNSHRVQIILFLVFIGLFFLLHFCLPDRSFSERENRVMQEAPRLTFSELFSGRFMTKFEKYMSDQFPARDAWTTLKARAEVAQGKQENKNVYLCPTELGPLDYMLIERFDAPEDSVIEKNVSALNTLCEATDGEVYFALIPGAGEICEDVLPSDAPMDSQCAVIEKAYALSEAKNVDMLGALDAHDGEYLFYGTDHHWTSRGAYYGYTAFAQAMGFEARPISDFEVETVTTEFYGTTYSSSGFSWVQPDHIERWVQQGENVSITNYPAGSPVEGSLYEDSFLAKKDKYASFLGGNTPQLVVETGLADKPKLLIVRDSYMDSALPFLLEDFSEIHMIDLRYFRTSLREYIAENEIDQVLVCYSVANFSTDANLFLLGL
ncbi:MAG: hypothetical protein E7444_06415 [Ruminococcaceae bacterium]|nr:hypothetical protein [Oscillospiraceae bacterium]